MPRKRDRLAVMAGLVGFLFAVAVVSVGAQTGPTLKITSPKPGEKIAGDIVVVQWESAGAKIVAAADAKQKEEAHFHLFLDRSDFKLGAEIPRGMEAEGIYHTAKTSHELKGLKPGRHYVFVVLSYNNHVPWDPFVYDVVMFETGAR